MGRAVPGVRGGRGGAVSMQPAQTSAPAPGEGVGLKDEDVFAQG